MGYFSWISSDTLETIVIGDVVTLILPNNEKITGEYDGYGCLGGEDIFYHIAKYLGHDVEFEAMRSIGIEAECDNHFPLMLVFNKNLNFDANRKVGKDRTQGGIFGKPKRNVTPLPERYLNPRLASVWGSIFR